MSTVCEVFGTQVHLVRKVRFDSVNEFDSETPWVHDGPTKGHSFTFRARVGIDTGVNSTSLFNMIAHISHKANDPFVSFRFFRPAHVNGIKKFQSVEAAKDGFSSVNLVMTFLGQDSSEKFSTNFSSTMDICGIDCACKSDLSGKLPCHTIESFCPVDWILDAMCKNRLLSGSLFAHLYVVFEIRLTGRVNSSYWSPNLEPRSMSSLSKAMKKILESSTLFDVTLKVGKEEFTAHMNILAGHSDVFAAMFEADMRERNQKVVEIDDMTPATVGILLKYLYCRELREIHESTQIAVDLLRAADKYNIKDLQQTCEDILLATAPDRFTISTALDAYLCGNQLAIPAVERHAV
ncbi:unnamed protein product, partial [Allacma fusca]